MDALDLDDLTLDDLPAGSGAQAPAEGEAAPAAAGAGKAPRTTQAVAVTNAAGPGAQSGFDETKGAITTALLRGPKASRHDGDGAGAPANTRPAPVPATAPARPKTFANQAAGSAAREKDVPVVAKSNALRAAMFSTKATKKPSEAPKDAGVVVGSLTGGAGDDDSSDDDEDGDAWARGVQRERQVGRPVRDERGGW